LKFFEWYLIDDNSQIIKQGVVSENTKKLTIQYLIKSFSCEEKKLAEKGLIVKTLLLSK
jgi:hypothetical protein